MKLNEILLEKKSEGPPVEIGELIKAFPSKHEKAIHKLWGGKRLVYKGQPLFLVDDNGHVTDLGPAYEGADKAVEDFLKNPDVEVEVYFKGNSETVHLDSEGDLEGQEVYLGYDPKTDRLWIGYDMFLRDDGADEGPVWNAFADLYYDHFGVRWIDDPDMKDSEQKRLDKQQGKAWKDFIEESHSLFQGALFELSSKNGRQFKIEKEWFFPNGFYRGIHGTDWFKSKKLVDLRLD